MVHHGGADLDELVGLQDEGQSSSDAVALAWVIGNPNRRMTPKTSIIHSIVTARNMTDGLLEGVAYRDWLRQPVPTGQHVLWIVGHLARADDWGLIALGLKSRLLDDIAEFFARGRPVTSDPQDYPAPEAVHEVYRASHQRFMDRLDVISDADLDRPTCGAIARFAPNLGTLLQSHVWHEGFHGGQLALIRRYLGLPVRWG